MDMNFIFGCSTRYRTSERSERVRYRVERVKIKFISTSWHVIFFLLYKHTNDDVDDFPNISEHFRPLSEDFRRFPKIVPKVRRTFPKIADDNRRFPRTDRRCFDHTVTHLSTFKEIMYLLQW